MLSLVRPFNILKYPSPITLTGKMRSYIFDDKVSDYRKHRDAVWDDLTSQAFICESTKPTYPKLVPRLLLLSSEVRKNLLYQVWIEIEKLLNSTNGLDTNDMFRWGSAHELLIGLEIDAWVRTPEGKQALLDLHGG